MESEGKRRALGERERVKKGKERCLCGKTLHCTLYLYDNLMDDGVA